MPDNIKYQSSVDRGWQQMVAILDREMPQKKRRLAGFWWVYGVAALILIAAASVLYLSGDHATSQEPQPSAREGMATVAEKEGVKGAPEHALKSTTELQGGKVSGPEGESEIHHANVGKGQLRMETPSGLVNGKSSENLSPKVLSHTEHGNVSSSRGVTAENRSHSVDKVNNTHIVSQSEARSVVSSEPESTNTEQNSVAFDETEGTNSSPVTNDRSLVLLPEINSLSSDLTWNRSPGVDAGFTAVLRQRKKLSLDALVGTHLNDQGNPFYGVEAGLAAVFRSDKKFRIRTGLSYGFYSVDGVGPELTNKSADVETTGSNPGTVLYDPIEVVNNSLDYEEAEQLTEEFHYLHLPVHVEYRIRPRFSLIAGVRTGLLVAAPARFKLNDERFAANYQSTAPGTRSFLYDYDILRKIDVAPEIMVSWKAGRRLWFDAGYIHGLVPYINKSDVSDRGDFHRMARIGARFTIL